MFAVKEGRRRFPGKARLNMSSNRPASSNRAKSPATSNGAKESLISAPAKGGNHRVIGVRQQARPARHNIIQRECTTTVAGRLRRCSRKGFGVEKPHDHVFTATPPRKRRRRPPRRLERRAPAHSTSSPPPPARQGRRFGPARIKGKLTACRFRVRRDGLVVDLTVQDTKRTSYAEIKRR